MASVCGALVEAVRAAANHCGFYEGIRGHKRVELEQALDRVEAICRDGTPETELASRMIDDLRKRVLDDIPR